MDNSELPGRFATLKRIPFHPHPHFLDSCEFLAKIFSSLEHQFRKDGKQTFPKFLQYLKENPQFKKHLQNCIKILFTESSCVDFLRTTGIPGDRGFLGDVLAWLKNKLVPLSLDTRQIDFFCDILSEKSSSFGWMKRIGILQEEEFFQEISMLENEKRGLWRDLKWQVCDALELLVSQVFTVAHSPMMVKIRYVKELPQSPFYNFQKSFFDFMNILRYSPQSVSFENSLIQEEMNPFFALFKENIQKCKEDVNLISSLFEERGASIDSIFRLEQIKTGIIRIEKLCLIIIFPRKKHSVFSFCAHLLELKKQEQSITFLASRNFNVLSKKVVEHAGNTGEHYVANSKKDALKMFYTSLGAGVLTVFTCALKFQISNFKAPPLADFILTGLNYSISFSIFHFLGLTLATKQPSATASHLAHSLHMMEKQEQDAEKNAQLEKNENFFSDIEKNASNFDPAIMLFLKIIRTQFIAVLGNLSAVIPASLVFCLFFNKIYKESFISIEKAQKTLANFSIDSPSLFLYAFLTGVLLWFASFLTGWAQNWIIFNRVSLPKFLLKNFTGIFSSLVLGFLLATPSFLGSLIGFSWDVRHVTLGAGSVIFALFAEWKNGIELGIWSSSLLYKSVFGIAAVGVFNVFVSFGCALFLALRALKLQGRDVFKVFLRTVYTMLKNPLIIFKI
jgi:site-specific recombinase